MSFKVGQKVVCIEQDAVDMRTGHINPCPKVDEVVEIQFIEPGGFLQFANYAIHRFYDPKCFRPLDYDFVEGVLESIKKVKA